MAQRRLKRLPQVILGLQPFNPTYIKSVHTSTEVNLALVWWCQGHLRTPCLEKFYVFGACATTTLKFMWCHVWCSCSFFAGLTRQPCVCSACLPSVNLRMPRTYKKKGSQEPVDE